MITDNKVPKKKRRFLALVVLGILALFLVVCTDQNKATQSESNTQSNDVPRNLQEQDNVSHGDGRIPHIDSNFSSGDKPKLPNGNFVPENRQMPRQDGNFTSKDRPDFPKDGNFSPEKKK
ncbi:MAG: hypothetical protein GYA60_05405 [Candidatus Methanofastidiosa archaeon]|nr:hypothetical protein [Candidatus Methanofastidiosa archaeon]